MKVVELKKKIPKFLILPLIVLLAFSIYSVIDRFDEKKALGKVEEYVNFTVCASNLIHELQKERGLSSGFLASKGKSFLNELEEQRKNTDQKMYLLNEKNHTFHKLTIENLNFFNKINEFRKDIDNNEAILSEIINYYTSTITALMIHVEGLIDLSHSGTHSVMIESYLALMQMKEYAGIERALISKIFAQGNISSKELYEFGELASAQEVYLKDFKHAANQKYIDIINSKESLEIFNKVEKNRDIIHQKNKKNDILAYMKELIVYMKFAHNNISEIEKQYTNLQTSIDKYKKFKNVSNQELKDLYIIKNVYSQYLLWAKKEKTKKNHKHNHDLDEILKTNYEAAKKALDDLKINIYASPEMWFNDSTNRIDFLKNLENKMVEDLYLFIEESKEKIIVKLIFQVIAATIILVVILVSIVLLRQLLEVGKMLNRAQENTRSSSFEYYIDDNIIFWSDEHYILLQVDKSFDPSLESFMKFIHPDDVEIFQKNIEKSIKQKKIVYFEYRIILQDSTMLNVRSSSEVIKYSIKGNPLIIVGTITDITESKKLQQEIIDTQKDVIFTMGAIGETRSKETGQHVKRVAKYSKLLYKLYGSSEDEAELLGMASPMHDIGKVGIPDDILNKPGKLTPNEWAIMQTHAKMGYDMLNNSDREILQVAATISLTHHEKYDGTGYPYGMVGEAIPIVGRITAIADVFDALGSDRCYKKAWELDKIINYLKEEKGKQFDSNLIDLFINNLDKFLEMRDKYND